MSLDYGMRPDEYTDYLKREVRIQFWCGVVLGKLVLAMSFILIKWLVLKLNS